MNWKPHYLEIRWKAESVGKKFQSGMSPKEISKDIGESLGSVYRYLRFTGDINGRKKDAKTGRFIPTQSNKTELPIDILK